MVFYYVARGDYHIYMGRDKFENEKLIEWGWPEDVWFHVDDLSSAHVYLRMKPVSGSHDCGGSAWVVHRCAPPIPAQPWRLAIGLCARAAFTRGRPPPGTHWQGDTIDTIPKEALYDCCQLVKVCVRARAQHRRTTPCC